MITFDDKISQGFADRLAASICGSLSLFLLNQNIFCSCPFGLDVGYLFALCLCYSTMIYSPGILLLTLHKGIEMLRGQESVKEEYQKVLPAGGSVPFILPFPISPPVAPLQIPPAPVGDDPFVGVLYNSRKNEMWE